MKTMRLVRARARPRERNRLPITGMSPSNGHAVERAPVIVVEQAADADDLAVVDGDRVLDLALVEDQVLEVVDETGPAIELTSTRRSSLIVPPALICGGPRA